MSRSAESYPNRSGDSFFRKEEVEVDSVNAMISLFGIARTISFFISSSPINFITRERRRMETLGWKVGAVSMLIEEFMEEKGGEFC